jgi:peroxiredoxin
MKFGRALACGLPWGLTTVEGGVIYLLVRQHGRLLLAQDELRERLDKTEQTLLSLPAQFAEVRQAMQAVQAPAAPPMPAGLPIGSPAPEFALPDLDGKERKLQEFLGEPLLTVFFNPQCGFCQQMAPQLGQLPQEGPRVLLISRGDAAEHRRLAAEHHWHCDVVLEPAWAVAGAYQANGTPMGYLLDAEGRIASPLAAGADAVLGLLPAAPAAGPASNGHGNGLTAQSLREKEHTAAEQARAAGLAVRESTLNRQGLAAGTKAPNFTLPDLKGKLHSLDQFRGRQVLLVFSDPDCGPCQALAPDLIKLHEQHKANNLEVVMVSRGDLTANVVKTQQHGLPFLVLRQRHWEVSKDYGMFATPVAYLIDEHGAILKDVAVGGDAIVQLVQTAVA